MMALILFLRILSQQNLVYSFFFLRIAHGLISSAACMVHIEYNKIASLHHLPVANLKSTFRVAADRAAAYFDFIIIGFKVFHVLLFAFELDICSYSKENNAQNNKGNRNSKEVHSTIAFEQTNNPYRSI